MTTKGQRNDTYLAPQIERGGIRVRAFCPQLRRKRTQRFNNALALRAARGNDARAEFLGRLWRGSEHRRVVVDPGIYQQRTVVPAARAVVVGAKTVDAAGLDVDACDLGAVVRREYSEFDGAAPGIGGENCAHVFVAWMPLQKRENTTQKKKKGQCQAK